MLSRFILLSSALVALVSGGRLPDDYTSPTDTPLKVVGGVLAPAEEYGYVAYINVGNGYCSGVLYADEYLLTAAHCFVGSTGDNTYNVTEVKVTLGINDLNARTDDDVYDVAEIWLRQGYKGMLLGMDLATIHLARPVPETVPKVKIITEELAALVKPSKTPAKVIGWGETYPRIYGETGEVTPKHNKEMEDAAGSTTMPELRVADMKLLTNKQCESRIRPSGDRLADGEDNRPKYIQKHMVCAEMSGTSVCAGDGGAPLIAQINDDWYLVGVASWSLNCAQQNHPNVFTRISSHLPWLNGGNDTILDRRALRGTLTSL